MPFRRPATWQVALFYATKTIRIPASGAAQALRIVDATWSDPNLADKLQTITIYRNGDAYLGCPRPDACEPCLAGGVEHANCTGCKCAHPYHTEG